MAEESPKEAIPGLLMRLANSQAYSTPQPPFSDILQVWTAVADDEKTPHQLTLYHLSDVSPLLSSSDLYEKDAAVQGGDDSLAWVVCSFVNGRSKDGSTSKTSSTHLLSHKPAQGSKLVINGSSPRAEKEDDYHGWYNEEHGPMLSLVPGWNENQRYRLEKSYGDVGTAKFYGFNYYDEQNGLGGAEWKASTNTEWTKRVRSNHEKPNIRRVWRVEHT